MAKRRRSSQALRESRLLRELLIGRSKRRKAKAKSKSSKRKLTKAERLKISMRNLRKAWAANRKRSY